MSQALAAEFAFAFVLCFVVLSVATIKTPCRCTSASRSAPTSRHGGIAIDNISGGSLNPAVSTDISAARIVGGGHFYSCLIYSAAEIAGAAVAAGVFMAPVSANLLSSNLRDTDGHATYLSGP